MKLADTPVRGAAPNAEGAASGWAAATVPPSLYDQVYASILDAICAGVLRPGERINQDEIAARLNVSRQPVTQALTVLRTQDFVQDSGRRGLVVAPLRRRFFESLYQLRESLDPMAARLAARHRGRTPGRGPDADPADLIRAGRGAVQTGAIASLTGSDMAFHVWVYETSGNALLTQTLRLYWHHLRRAMIAVVGPSHDRGRVWDDHDAILAAILAGDEQTAERLSLQHIREAAQRVIRTFPE